MSFRGFSILRSFGHFVKRSGQILAILEVGHPRNIPVEFSGAEQFLEFM